MKVTSDWVFLTWITTKLNSLKSSLNVLQLVSDVGNIKQNNYRMFQCEESTSTKWTENRIRRIVSSLNSVFQKINWMLIESILTIPTIKSQQQYRKHSVPQVCAISKNCTTYWRVCVCVCACVRACVCVCVWVGGWFGGWVGGWLDGWVAGWLVGWTVGWIDDWMDEWVI